jgi:hypothetical protein
MKTTEKGLYHKPALDAYVEEELKEIDQRLVINAQNYAARNKPPLLNKQINAYFHEDHMRYQSVIDAVGRELQFKAVCNEVVEHEKLTEGQLHTLHNKLATAREKQIGAGAKLESRKPPFNKSRQLLAWAAVATIALFEGMLSLPVFQTWGYSLAEAVCISILFAGMLAILAHLFKRIVLLGRTIWQQRAIAVTLLLLLTVLFGYMSQTRAEYLSRQMAANSADTVNMHFSSIPFVLTSILLFIVAVAVCHFFMPSREERAALKAYKIEEQKRRADEEAIQQLEQAIEATKHENAELRKVNASILEYGCMLEQLIVSRAHGGFALWKRHNMMHRPDNGRPICFDDPDYPFAFITNFHSLKLL